MNSDAQKYDVTIDTITHFIREWSGQPNRKGARQDLINTRNRLRIEAATGRIPLLILRKETRLDRIKSWLKILLSRPIREWVTMIFIISFTFSIEPLFRGAIAAGQLIETFFNN